MMFTSIQMPKNYQLQGLMIQENQKVTVPKLREVNNLNTNYGYYNSGVTFCDNSTAKKKKLINRLNNKQRSRGKNSDNMLLNEYIQVIKNYLKN